MTKKQKEKLIELGIEPKFYKADGYCVCLIKKGGNPENKEDRVGYVEVYPQVFFQEEWHYGPEGINSEYEPSRQWCIEEIIRLYPDNPIERTIILSNKDEYDRQIDYFENFDFEYKEITKTYRELLEMVKKDFENLEEKKKEQWKPRFERNEANTVREYCERVFKLYSKDYNHDFFDFVINEEEKIEKGLI